MEDYSAMSDHLINQQVAESLTGRYLYFPDYVWDSEEETRFNPCNDPADAWPIITANGVSLMFDGEWQACANLKMDSGGLCIWDYYTLDSNPLRAAMIVYLKMKPHEFRPFFKLASTVRYGDET